jgi:subfamily B ATP-binding cassette protein MsbA
MADMRSDNYNAVLRLPTTFFSQKGVTDSVSRFMKDTAEVASGQAALLGSTLVEPAKGAAALAVAMLLSWKLTLLTIAVAPVSYSLIRGFGKAMRRAGRRMLELWSDMMMILQETLSEIRVVKCYTMEASERRRFLRVNRQLLDHQARMAAIECMVSPAAEVLGIIAAMVATGIAGYLLLHNKANLDREKFLVLFGCLGTLFVPVRVLAQVATRM